jgi:P pilus assembly chaperone PapD
MKKAFLAIFLALILAVALAAPVFAGVTVYNGKIEETVSPGKTYTYTMTVQNSADSPADFGVEVDGYGTSANQDFVMLSPTNDTSPESARTMLTVTPTNFHLEANATQELTVTATIPPGTGAGGRYAIVFIHTIAASDQQVATVSAVAARVLLTVTGNTTDTSTQVTAVDPITAMNNNTAGVLVTVTDNGNYYVKPQVEATLMDGSKIIATGSVNTGWPIIPGYSRQYQVNFTGQGTIPAGKYQVDVTVKDAAGNLITSTTVPVQFSSKQVFQTTTTTSGTAPSASTITVVEKSGANINWTIIVVAVIGGVIIIVLLVLVLQKRKTS